MINVQFVDNKIGIIKQNASDFNFTFKFLSLLLIFYKLNLRIKIT